MLDLKYMTVLGKKNQRKGAELPTKSMGKGLHKLFKAVVSKLKNALPKCGKRVVPDPDENIISVSTS